MLSPIEGFCHFARKRSLISYGQTRLTERKKWVDVLRAIAMVLVVYGHRVSGWSEYFVLTSPVKIPLFFAITGYVFNDAGGNPKIFIRKLWRTVIIPWIIIAGLPYVAATPIKGLTFFKSNLTDVLTGVNYWYMPCCIVAEIIWFFILKYARTEWLKAIIAVIMFAVGIMLYKHGILSIFMVNRALSVQIFLYIGRTFCINEEAIVRKLERLPVLLGGTFLYILLGVFSLVFYPGQSMDVHLCRYYNILICGPMIWSGIYLLTVFVMRYMNDYPKWLVLIGQNTLVIYLLHSYCIKVLVKVFDILHIPVNRFTNIFITLIVCTAGTLISLILHRFFPELMGKKRISR